jgi:hypothetical protein
MVTRRNLLVRAGALLLFAPAIVRRESLVPARGVVMPVERVHYGWVDRLRINSRYRSGELRGPGLLRVIDDGVLRHVAPEKLADDIARWGLGPLPPAARKERARYFNYQPAVPPRRRPQLQPENAKFTNAAA